MHILFRKDLTVNLCRLIDSSFTNCIPATQGKSARLRAKLQADHISTRIYLSLMYDMIVVQYVAC